MRYSLLFSIILLAFVSCNKNKYNSIPSLTYKSVSTNIIRNQGQITFTLAFTDAEGDLFPDSALFVQEKVLNCNLSTAGFAKQYYKLPAFPTTKNQDGNLLVTYGYNLSSGQNLTAPACSKNDTAVFRFVLRDQANHHSDTAVSDKVVVVF